MDTLNEHPTNGSEDLDPTESRPRIDEAQLLTRALEDARRELKQAYHDQQRYKEQVKMAHALVEPLQQKINELTEQLQTKGTEQDQRVRDLLTQVNSLLLQCDMLGQRNQQLANESGLPHLERQLNEMRAERDSAKTCNEDLAAQKQQLQTQVGMLEEHRLVNSNLIQEQRTRIWELERDIDDKLQGQIKRAEVYKESARERLEVFQEALSVMDVQLKHISDAMRTALSDASKS